MKNSEAADVLKSQLRQNERQNHLAEGLRRALEKAVTALQHAPEVPAIVQRPELTIKMENHASTCDQCASFLYENKSGALCELGQAIMLEWEIQETSNIGCRGLQCETCRTLTTDCSRATCPRCGGVDLREVTA